MKQLLNISDEQVLKIMPREYASIVSIKVIDDSTDSQINTTVISSVKNRNYLDITATFDLKEGRFYDLRVYKLENEGDDLLEENIIYKDKIFCTSQDVNQLNNDYYSVNKEEYIQHSSDDNIIIL
jgi:hypothetical protein